MVRGLAVAAGMVACVALGYLGAFLAAVRASKTLPPVDYAPIEGYSAGATMDDDGPPSRRGEWTLAQDGRE